MSSVDGDASTSRRKSGRVSKPIERLGVSNKKSRKNGKSSDNDQDSQEEDEDEEGASSQDGADSDAEPTSDEEAEDDDDFRAPKKSTAGGKKRKSSANGAGGGGKRGRTTKGSSPTAKGKKASQPRKPRAKKTAPGGDGDDSDEAAGAEKKTTSGKDFPIEDDNGLFNAVKSPNTALQTTAEDWVESYKEDSGPAMAELVNFVLRCCGCNASIDEHQAEDENGIVENLKDIVDEFKQETAHAYPLVSKSKGYKKFRSSLGQFLMKLLNVAAEDVLFSTSFYEHFQAWTHALSSSQIRALRHTATVIVLLSIDALTTLEVSIRKEHSQATRAKEAEIKKNRKDKARLKDMEKQVSEIHERLEAVEGFEEEAYTSVFVNRYRDADHDIRAECIASLGKWMELNPDHWIDGDYLRYIGWVLSDESKEARRDSLRALFSLYKKEAYIGKLHHFTDRFKAQLVDMALGEHDLAVRVQAIQVVRQIDGHGLLEEDQRDEVAQLVFEKEKRVRAAAAELFRGVVEEEVEQRKQEIDAEQKTTRGRKIGGKKAKKDEEELQNQIELKVVAELLVKYGKALDGIDEQAGNDGEEEEEEEEDHRKKAKDASLSDLIDLKFHRGRVALAAEALWSGDEAADKWEALLSFLLKDHSVHAFKGKANGKQKGKGKKNAREENGDEDEENGQNGDEASEEEHDEEVEGSEIPSAVKFTEEEETLAIELLVACLTIATTKTSTSKKDKEDEDERQATIARAVIDALPRLFSKHQTFPSRMIDILAIPRLIQLELYHDQITAYESLWDDVKKQFLKHTDPDVLDQAVRTIVHFLDAADLSTQNQTKFPELEEGILSSLRQSVAEKDIESSTFEEDEIHDLTASVARLAKLSKVKNVGTSLDDNDGGKQTSIWEILDSIVNRGRLGYKEETEMIEHALAILGTHLIWQLQIVAMEARDAGSIEESTLDSISARRRSLLEKTEEFAVGNESNACDGVKEVALSVLLDIHFVSSSITALHIDPDQHLASLRLECGEELQARCSGYVEAEIERYSEQLAQEQEAEEAVDEEEEQDGTSGSDTEMEESAKKRKKKGKGKKVVKGKKAAPKKQEQRKKKTPAALRKENARMQSRLVASQRFQRNISTFARAIHRGIFDLRHASVILKYWGRFGPTFDDFVRLLMHDLRDEGNYGNQGELVATVLVETLQGALDLYLDSSDSSDEHLVSLGRNLLQVIVIRGAQLKVVKSLPSENHLKIHLDALDYIVKQIKQFTELKRSDDRNKALSFFKALAHLVFGLDGRSALKAKTTLDSLLEKHGVEVSTTSKIWEPIRAYEKRLISNMAKDDTIKSKAQAQAKTTSKKGKGKSKQTDEEDDQFDEADEIFGRSPAPASPSRRRSTRGQKRATPDDADQGEEGEEEEGRTPSAKRIRTEEPEELVNGSRHSQQPIEEEEEERREPEQNGSQGDISGSLDNTLAMAEEERPTFERGESVESTMSLSDLKKKRRRGN